MLGSALVLGYLTLVFGAHAYFADELPLVGYGGSGGSFRDAEASFANVQTRVMPYSAVGQSGYVHGFRVNAAIAGLPFTIQIWRHDEGYWDADGTWQNLYSTGMRDGYYTVVYTTAEQYSTQGETYIYLQTGVQVQRNDFIGFSFRRECPVDYRIDNSCNSTYTQNSMTSSGYPAARMFFEFDPNRASSNCRTYPIGMLVEYTDPTTVDCRRINLVALNTTFHLQSHVDYPNTDYSSNMDVCWVVHSYDVNHYVTFTLNQDSDFDLEYFTSCGYDHLIFYRNTGSGFSETDRYCHVSQLPNTREVFIQSSKVMLRFITDGTRNAQGFRFNVLSVDTDYTPSTSTNPEAGASSGNNNNCDGDDDLQWDCLSTAAKVLLVVIGILLILLCLILLACCIWFCCCRPREKVNPNMDDTYLSPVSRTASQTKAIPYEETSIGHYDYSTPFGGYVSRYEDEMPIYKEIPAVKSQNTPNAQRRAVENLYCYGEPKGLRPLSEPLGNSYDYEKY